MIEVIITLIIILVVIFCIAYWSEWYTEKKRKETERFPVPFYLPTIIPTEYQPSGNLIPFSLPLKPIVVNGWVYPMISNVYFKDEHGGIWQRNLDDGTFRYVFYDSKNEYVKFEPQQSQANS